MKRQIRTFLWLLAALVMLYPLVWLVISSFKGSNLEIFDRPFSLPGRITYANYGKAIREGRMGDYFINSLWVTISSAVITVWFGAWAGFALSKTRFPGQRLWLALFFVGM